MYCCPTMHTFPKWGVLHLNDFLENNITTYSEKSSYRAHFIFLPANAAVLHSRYICHDKFKIQCRSLNFSNKELRYYTNVVFQRGNCYDLKFSVLVCFCTFIAFHYPACLVQYQYYPFPHSDSGPLSHVCVSV